MVLRANARLSVVTSACPYRGPIERVDEAALRRGKCNVRRTSRLSLADPEVGPRLCTHPDCLAEIHDHFVAERRQRGEEKLLAAGDIRNRNAEMIKHRRILQRQ